MKAHTEIKLCWITNDLKYKNKWKPATGAEITKFYNGLVDSDFSSSNTGPSTFGKESRFRNSRVNSPGPGHYNPTRNRLSKHSISKTIADIHNKDGSIHWPAYFN